MRDKLQKRYERRFESGERQDHSGKFQPSIEPEGKMSIRRTNTPIGAEYDISFAGSEEWEYIKAVFQTFAFIASR